MRPTKTGPQAKRPDAETAARARREAEARRAQIDEKTLKRPKELHGRGGLDPVRFGDWEIKGLTSDF